MGELSSQINDASLSVLFNIAEGFSRRRDKETLQFLRYAFASNGELKSGYYAAAGRNYLSEVEDRRLDCAEREHCRRMLRRWQATLDRRPSGAKDPKAGTDKDQGRTKDQGRNQGPRTSPRTLRRQSLRSPLRALALLAIALLQDAPLPRRCRAPHHRRAATRRSVRSDWRRRASCAAAVKSGCADAQAAAIYVRGLIAGTSGRRAVRICRFAAAAEGGHQRARAIRRADPVARAMQAVCAPPCRPPSTNAPRWPCSSTRCCARSRCSSRRSSRPAGALRARGRGLLLAAAALYDEAAGHSTPPRSGSGRRRTSCSALPGRCCRPAGCCRRLRAAYSGSSWWGADRPLRRNHGSARIRQAERCAAPPFARARAGDAVRTGRKCSSSSSCTASVRPRTRRRNSSTISSTICIATSCGGCVTRS